MVSRRQLFAGALGITGATAAVAGSGAALAESYKKGFNQATLDNHMSVAKSAMSWSGVHQAGIESKPQSHTNFIALDLKPGITSDDMLRWMVLLTDDISSLAAGNAVLGDPSPELIIGPANFSATVGFGPTLFKKLALDSLAPEGLIEVPPLKIDALRPEYSSGDVLLHISGDDAQSLGHATRTLLRDSETFANVRWFQAGFTNAVGVSPPGATQRNLMGQMDGTDNPPLGSQLFNDCVWIADGPAWAIGGTQLVLRRIKMNLDTWDTLGRPQKEQVIGRHLDSGAPLGGMHERDPVDLEALDSKGFKIIPEFAHIRRASSQLLDEIFFRRPFNYQELSTEADAKPGQLESGLLWTAYARNLSRQYLPVQKRLAEFDLLNKWTTPVGSATFAIARGIQPGEILAEELFN